MIRELNCDDYNEYLNLISEFRKTNFSKEDFTNFLKNNKNTEIWVYQHNNIICGTVTLLLEQKLIHNMGKVGHIEDVFILQKFRNMGIGKKLIQFLIERCAKLKCYKITLYCNSQITKFYQGCSFNKKGIQMEYRF